MGDGSKGIYKKFEVTRIDGKSASGEKHHGCRYFVLDIDHDPFARAAIEAYAKACKEKYPALAEDLMNMDFGALNTDNQYNPKYDRYSS